MVEELIQEIQDAKEAMAAEFSREERAFAKALEKVPHGKRTNDEVELLRNFRKLNNRIVKTKGRLKKARAWQKKVDGAEDTLKRLQDKINGSSKLFCLDLEFHEFSKKIIEVGVTLWENGKLTSHHFIVKERVHQRNKRYVPDHKHNFSFGASEILSMREIRNRIHELSDFVSFYVGHSFDSDKGFLTDLGYDCPKEKVLDTQGYAPIYLLKNQQHGLGHLVQDVLGEEPQFMHNAGNDANYTMRVLLKMAGVI